MYTQFTGKSIPLRRVILLIVSVTFNGHAQHTSACVDTPRDGTYSLKCNRQSLLSRFLHYTAFERIKGTSTQVPDALLCTPCDETVMLIGRGGRAQVDSVRTKYARYTHAAHTLRNSNTQSVGRCTSLKRIAQSGANIRVIKTKKAGSGVSKCIGARHKICVL